MTQPVTIYLFRHAQSQGNVKKIVGGNLPLTELGDRQAQDCAKHFSTIDYRAVYSSDRLRAQQTARYFAQAKGLTVQIDQDLRERDYGVYENRDDKDYKEEVRGLFPVFDRLPPAAKMEFKYYPSYETSASMVKRFRAALIRIAQANPGATVMVVAHERAIWLFLHAIGFIKDYKIMFDCIENTGWVKLVYDQTFRVLDSYELKLG
ncbi:histidine phosphatase family protein [Patescibacteria group bacterium]|nr:histidine phosphatase family protein [Patescibacteria group bacterium]MCL5091468.1 histidine phosphatase family protein [Patescibacteria group bacterium]